MEISKAAIGVFAVACVTAGAGGAYLANRTPAAPPAAQTAAPSVSPDPAAPAVEQSEAVVAPTAPAPTAVAPVPTPAPADTRKPRAERPAPARPAARPPATIAAAVPPVEHVPAPVSLDQPRPVTPEPEHAPEPSGPVYQELVVSADSVIGLQVESSVTSETARIEDPVVARVTRDVKVGGRVAIPAGSRANGEVTMVERGGKLRDRARLGVRFTSVVLADGTRVPISTETIYREGDSPGNESAAKIGGGAIGGAIIGGILGGAKGAAIGSGIGAGAGTAATMAGGRNAATLTSGSPVTVRLQSPATVTVEKD